YRASARLLRRALGGRSHELAEVVAAHAEIAAELGHHHRALALGRAAYAAIERISGDAAHTTRTRILGALGNVHRTLGDYPRAGALLRRALAMVQKTGAGTRDAALAWNNLGILYKYTGEFDRARVHYQQALRITRRVCGADHLDIAGLY